MDHPAPLRNTQTSVAISKRFILHYPDHSKKRISRSERDELLLSGLAKETSPEKYFFIGQQHTYRLFSALRFFVVSIDQETTRRFLPGRFIYEHRSVKGGKRREMLETPEAMASRLKLYETKNAEVCA